MTSRLLRPQPGIKASSATGFLGNVIIITKFSIKIKGRNAIAPGPGGDEKRKNIIMGRPRDLSSGAALCCRVPRKDGHLPDKSSIAEGAIVAVR